MKILGIETSCDETAAAIVEDGTKILSNVVASSSQMHIKSGGIIPENAARQQVKSMIPVIDQSLVDAGLSSEKIDAIAVTAGGPGLIGSMLVGVETAKTLAFVWQKPLVPVVHLAAHLYANFLLPNHGEIKFPALILTVSGGHSDLFLMQGHGQMKHLGGTRDDAAGEAFDKIARILNLPYPGGPSIQIAAESGNRNNAPLPIPMHDSPSFDYSFSGIKTAVLRFRQTHPQVEINDIAASVEFVIATSLIEKALKALKTHPAKNILVAGGVAANKKLCQMLVEKSPVPVFVPPVNLCTDNATFIASAAFFNFQPVAWQKVTAIPDAFEALKFYGHH